MVICEKEEVGEKEVAGEQLMEVDIADASNGCLTEIRKNGLLLWPVSPQEGGEGLPYAPANWPEEGDMWGWRVGKRVAASGYYLDRYLYLPVRFQRSRRKRDGFASKLSVEQYIRARFPGTDVNAFFSSFSWKIPSKQAYLTKDEHGSFCIQSEGVVEQSPSDLLPDAVGCKAGNRFCSSLIEDQMTPAAAAAQACDICCSEPGFCRECCCILCSQIIESVTGGYNFFRCEAIVEGDLICGHAAHIKCALRAYMAGTVGGTIELDTTYHCRRCDSRTELTKHVTNLMKTCESLATENDIDKMLAVGACLLQRTNKKDSKRMLIRFQSLITKREAGCSLEDLWKVEVDAVPIPTGQNVQVNIEQTDTDDIDVFYQNEYQQLEEEIDQVLLQLKTAQHYEFRVAQDKLYAQKDRLLSLYQQVHKEKSDLKLPTPSTDRNALLNSIAAREAQIQCELSKLRDMEKVADGFGRSPKPLLKEHFNLDYKD